MSVTWPTTGLAGKPTTATDDQTAAQSLTTLARKLRKRGRK